MTAIFLLFTQSLALHAPRTQLNDGDILWDQASKVDIGEGVNLWIRWFGIRNGVCKMDDKKKDKEALWWVLLYRLSSIVFLVH